MAGERFLCLFSSDQTERYAQDVLDILGLPRGSHYTFRYRASHVRADLARAWEKDELRDRKGLVCFAVQQRAEYTPAAFVPIRMIRVLASERVGTHLLITFSLEELVALPRGSSSEARRDAVREFTELLRGRCDTPYERWASEGTLGGLTDPSQGGFEADGDDDRYFEQTAEYLAGADVFSEARFIRFRSLAEVGGSVPQRALAGDPPALRLTAGKTYELGLVHFVPEGHPWRGAFEVSIGASSVQVLGRSEIAIGSRYDKQLVRLATHARNEYGTEWTTLVVTLAEGLTGPRLDIPVRVDSSVGPAAAQSVATALGLIVLALPAVIHITGAGWRLLIAGAGAAIVGLVQVFFKAALPGLLSIVRGGQTQVAPGGHPEAAPHGAHHG